LAKSFFNTGLLGAAGSSAPSDDQFNRVSFLSHFEGSNNGVNNAFDDSSASNHTITANGNVTQGSFGPFARPDGEWGVSFDGGSYVTSNYLQVAESSDFDFGTGDFTVELFFFNRAYGAYYDYLVTFGNNVSATTSFGIYLGSGTNINLWNNGAIASSTSYNKNQWYHLAVVRASGTVKVYLDGSEIKSASLSSDISSPGGMNVANWRLSGDGQYFNGIISNLRVVKGTAVYTGNFTAPTSKLTAITNTVLLTCQSNRFVDNSATGHTVTPYVSPAVTAFGPFLSSSVYKASVNGASSIGGYVAAATSTDWQFGSGNFTVEFWTYPLGTGNWVIAHGDGSIAGTSISWQYGHGTFDFYYGSSYVQITSPTLTLNSWQHIAVVRNGATITVYKDGTSTGTGNIGSNTLNTGGTDPFYVGNYPDAGSGYINGYLSDVRVVKGTAVYTSNFTPPTAPLTAITNTKLLLNMADGQAIDSAAQNTLTLVNDAKTSTTRAKFGNTSLYLDGSDYAIIENSQSRAFGTGDFTVEFFIWLNGSPDQFDYIFDMRSSSDLTYTWALSFNYMGSATNDELQWASNNTSPNAILRAVYPSLNQWVHIAVCRSGTTTRMFYDGTQVAINTSDSADYRNTGYQGYIGCRHSLETYIDAYMDEIRFSKFARYTSNFTAPTEPFADKGQDA
tara:strand:+ start:1484 stop:3511 length:2028 start_codon:yes stop_codon:yes gene_type:complete